MCICAIARRRTTARRLIILGKLILYICMCVSFTKYTYVYTRAKFYLMHESLGWHVLCLASIQFAMIFINSRKAEIILYTHSHMRYNV